MLKFIATVILSALISTPVSALDFDKRESINGVRLKSGKTSAIRHYIGESTKTLPFPLKEVIKRITNFEDKCNNEYRSMRKFTEEEKDCPYHNEHLIESFVVPTGDDPNVFLVGRQIYNRGRFSHYDLVRIKEGRNEEGQKTVTITQTMLDDAAVKKYFTPAFEKDSAFIESSGTFILTELDKQRTQVTYEYRSKTDHWLLNKELSVPQVFASISKSIGELFESVEGKANRELASN